MRMNLAIFLAAAAVIAGPPARAQSYGEPPCEMIRLGMTFAYRMQFSPLGVNADTAQYPTVGTLCPGGAADRAGLRSGDVLLMVNGQDFRRGVHLLRAEAGGDLVIRVRRGDRELDFTVTVPPRPADAPPPPSHNRHLP